MDSQSQPAPWLQALSTPGVSCETEGGPGSLGEAGTPGYVSHWMDKLLGKACFCCRKRECQKRHRTRPRFSMTDKEEMALGVPRGVARKGGCLSYSLVLISFPSVDSGRSYSSKGPARTVRC